MPTVDLDQLEPVEGNPFAGSNDLTPGILARGAGTLSADNPPWGDRLAGGFSNLMGMIGATPRGQQNAYEFAQKGIGLIPGVSNAVSANQAYRDYGSGNYLGGILNTIGAAVPPIPGAGGVAEEAGGIAARDLGSELRALGRTWKNAPVIDAAGNVVRGSIIPDKTIGGPLGILDEQGTLNKGLLSYHGSSHSWDAPDWSKVGTGEGTADEGWGFYSATNPKVAEAYRTMGGEEYVKDASGNPIPIASMPELHAQMMLAAKDGDYDKAIAHAEKGAKWDINNSADTYNAAKSMLENWRDAGVTLHSPESNKYMLATTADPDKFLNLSKPIDNQAPEVRDAVNKVWNDFYGKETTTEHTGQDVHDNLFSHFMEKRGFDDPSDMSWKDKLATHKDVADTLKDAGLPGVKYLDDLSEQGVTRRQTYNYVTYPAAIRVLKKYGIPAGLGGAGLGHIMMNHPNMDTYQIEEGGPSA